MTQRNSASGVHNQIPDIEDALDELLSEAVVASLRDEQGLPRAGLKERHPVHLFARDVELFRRMYPNNYLASAVRYAFHQYMKVLEEKKHALSGRNGKPSAKEASTPDSID